MKMKGCMISFLCLLFPAVYVVGIPMQSTIALHEKECLYDYIEVKDTVTVSAIILSGSSLKGILTLRGPLPNVYNPTATTLEVYESVQTLSSTAIHKLPLTYSQMIDWEHLLIDISYDDDDDQEKMDPNSILLDDDDNNVAGNKFDEMEDDSEEKKAILAKREEKRQRKILEWKEKMKIKMEKRKAKVDELKRQQQAIAKDEGDPVQYTVEIAVPGWYEACLDPIDDVIVAELEMRKASELGGLDEDGNVYTYEEYSYIQQEKEMEEKDTASEEDMKEEEFQALKTLLKEMGRKLNQIQGIQMRDRRLLAVTETTAQHSHSRFVLHSVIETMFFMAITGYQIYTIRKWFSTGEPKLGR